MKLIFSENICRVRHTLTQFNSFISKLSRDWKIISQVIARCVVKVRSWGAFKLNRVLINYATRSSSTALATIFNYKLSIDFLICKWNIQLSGWLHWRFNLHPSGRMFVMMCKRVRMKGDNFLFFKNRTFAI